MNIAKLIAWITLIAVTVGAATLAPPAWAQGAEKTIHVATRVVPPFVVKKDGKLSGFSIELWEAIGERLHFKTTWNEKTTVGEILASVKSSESEAGTAAISITSQRERDYEFSQPFFTAGLQIMVNDQNTGGWSFVQAVRDLFSPDILKLIGLVLVLVLIPAHLVWLVERKHEEKGLVETKRYFPGIFKTIWWSTATLATQADEMPKSYAGRIIASIWMFTSVVFIAYFTAQITTSLTVKQLRGDIKGPGDLPGKRVATIAGSTSEAYLKDKNATIVTFTKIDDAIAALEQSKADAVVYDAPILLYYSSHEGKGKVAMVGSAFKSEGYGVLFPSNSSWRKPVNQAILTLREDGTYDKLYEKWFGDAEK